MKQVGRNQTHDTKNPKDQDPKNRKENEMKRKETQSDPHDTIMRPLSAFPKRQKVLDFVPVQLRRPWRKYNIARVRSVA